MRNCWPSLNRGLALFRQLDTLEDLLLFLKIFLFAASVPLLFRLKLTKLESLVKPKYVLTSPDATKVKKIITFVDTTQCLGWPLVRRRCLTRGLTLYYFLSKAGLDVSLCFGMGNLGEDRFMGHCWLIKDGEPYLETSDPRPVYTAMHTFPSNKNPNRITDNSFRTKTKLYEKS